MLVDAIGDFGIVSSHSLTQPRAKLAENGTYRTSPTPRRPVLDTGLGSFLACPLHAAYPKSLAPHQVRGDDRLGNWLEPALAM
jgi:hypothetical protein